jgi:hypothetical protein
MILKKRLSIGLYTVVRHADPAVLDFARSECLQNTKVAVGLDVLFFEPLCVEAEKKMRTLRLAYMHATRIILSIRWYIRMAMAGHIIVPIPFIVDIYGLISYFRPRHNELDSYATPVDAYYAGKPTRVNSVELLGTYIRFAAQEQEEYGLKKAGHSYYSLYFRATRYRQIVEICFGILRPCFFFSLYSGYLHHQIPCDIASICKVTTLVIGCSDCLYRISNSSMPRQFYPVVYSKSHGFALKGTTESIIAQGLSSLQARLKGNIDSSISYMNASPYQSSPDTTLENSIASLTASKLVSFKANKHYNADWRKFITIYMHEFSDWHHNGVLPDFASSYYDWLLQTCLILCELRIPFVVKIHPAIAKDPVHYKQSIKGIGRIAEYLDIPLVYSAAETTLDLIESGMALGVTVRGTVATELTVLRIPFLCAGKPPYSTLLNRRVVVTKQDYVSRLQNFTEEPHITDQEVSMAAYYVGILEEAAKTPDKHLNHTSSLTLSSDAEYALYKAKM